MDASTKSGHHVYQVRVPVAACVDVKLSPATEQTVISFAPRGAEAIVSVTTLLGLSQFLLALHVAGRYSLPVSGEAHPVIINKPAT